MKVNAFKCPKCAAIVFSRTRHDYRWCACKRIAVDGGLESSRVVYESVLPENVTLEVDQT